MSLVFEADTHMPYKVTLAVKRSILHSFVKKKTRLAKKESFLIVMSVDTTLLKTVLPKASSRRLGTREKKPKPSIRHG